jgi:hypothetical protein
MVGATNYRTSLKAALQEAPAIPPRVLRIQQAPVLSIQEVQDRLLHIPPAVPIPALHRTLRQEPPGQNKFIAAKIDPGDLRGLLRTVARIGMFYTAAQCKANPF